MIKPNFQHFANKTQMSATPSLDAPEMVYSHNEQSMQNINQLLTKKEQSYLDSLDDSSIIETLYNKSPQSS